MRAARQESLDGPSDLHLADVPEPAADDGAVLIDVHSSTAVYPDLLQTRGLYQVRAEPPYVPGTIAAGTVRTAAHGFEVGQPVVALTGLGGWAEVATAAPNFTLPLPEGMPLSTAAALPFNYGTMYFGLVRRGGLRAGETVLVHGAAGGIGSASIQLAAALGAGVIAVVSSDAKGEIARAAGAHEVIGVDGFKDAALALTGGAGVDLVVDPVGGDRFTDSLRSLAPEGRLLVIGFTGGDIPTVKVNRLLLNNISVVGVGWGAFAMPRPAYLREEWDEMLPVLAGFEPVIGATYPLADAAQALQAIDERRAVGNVVIAVR
ncbi:NADPH:quinone oxidoreductase family protein [Jatrophihabitans endophyticus]|uniref:NADPH:quinone oxidoreductase family protein n=1 Tax=Jatrophihabitans endophyticus TaxID=1206085 RepID=UPI0019DE9B4A|nr:NADPH:quinone oxidoreductase family protein [Jatrophihabitans endophyticus]MBE7187717.1 NADPH:quinone oxidoreductase family protein [Jatrophihabitans endophyticus]